ncbi:MAG TPA: Ig-like domain-containing protein [Terracidiphilus sp.]|nr:Ig-like domain-containing protein [Terracidiphilus sp.]
MFDRVKSGALLLIGIVIALPIMGCGSAQVDSLQVTPAAISMNVGTQAQLTATGIYSHGSGPATTENLTDQVTWSSASNDVATVSSTGMVTATGAGLIQITASIPGYTGVISASSTITVASTGTTSPNGNDITKLTITPGSQTVEAPGDTATYTVVGTTAAGAQENLNGTVVWSTSSTQIATVNASTGVVTAVGPGTATIEATYTNADTTVATGTATFTVTGTGSTDTDIVSITIIPGAQSVPTPGDTATFVAVGTNGSGSVLSMQNLVTWSSSSTQIATIAAATGVATAVGQGTATITAQYENADNTIATGTATFTVTGSGTTNTDITQVSIIPTSQTVASPGDTATFTATGTTASGVTKSLTDLVWASSSPQIATIASDGVAQAVGQGTTTISAQYTNADASVATGTATFTVTGNGSSNNDITSITIVPGSQSVPAPGDTATFIAVGTTASGATVSLQGIATFSSSSMAIAQVTNSAAGIVTGETAGTATITATYVNADKNIATGTATFTVLGGTTEQWTAVNILPSSQSISAEKGTANFIALGTSGAGTIEDVTSNPNIQWLSSITGVATVSNSGLVTGVSVGTTTITALLSNTDGSVVSSTATLTTTLTAPPEPILSLTIIPSSITVLDFQLTGQFLAVATLANPPYVEDVTNSPNTTWLSSEPEQFPVDTNSGGVPGSSAGLVTAYASGGATIIAEASEVVSGSTTPTIQTATATFNCPLVVPGPGVTTPSCYPGEEPAQTLLSTLTVYNEGLNTTNWEVTAASATGTANVLHCGPGWTLGGGAGGSVCTSTYPEGTLAPNGTTLGVLIEAQQVLSGGQTGTFGGWSYSCEPSDSQGNLITAPPYWTAAGPNYCVAPLQVNYCVTNSSGVQSCQIIPNVNVTVGAIFN